MSTVTVFLIVIAFVGLPCVGVGAVLVACRSHARRIRTTARIVAALLILFILAAVAEIAPYMWALHLETRWSSVHPPREFSWSRCSLFIQFERLNHFSHYGGVTTSLGPARKWSSIGSSTAHVHHWTWFTRGATISQRFSRRMNKTSNQTLQWMAGGRVSPN
jgi:hypothetical protein